ncbi:hypothetical protein L9F63_020791, partial [Diploptera punctata]
AKNGRHVVKVIWEDEVEVKKETLRKKLTDIYCEEYEGQPTSSLITGVEKVIAKFKIFIQVMQSTLNMYMKKIMFYRHRIGSIMNSLSSSVYRSTSRTREIIVCSWNCLDISNVSTSMISCYDVYTGQVYTRFLRLDFTKYKVLLQKEYLNRFSLLNYVLKWDPE